MSEHTREQYEKEIASLRAQVERISKASSELLVSLDRQEQSPFGLALNHEIAMRSRIDIAKTKLSAALAATWKEV